MSTLFNLKPDYNSTLRFVAELFSDAKDKAGLPYLYHLVHVAENVESDDEEIKMIALLHDVIEDTFMSAEGLLKMRYSKRVVDGVVALTKLKVGKTKKSNEPYRKYLDRVQSNPDAIIVKISDLKHNSDLTRLDTKSIGDYELKRHAKYMDALLLLEYF